MSHGGGGDGDSVSSEPNLTPLLDMVLQLVMFFMLVANFISDEFSDKIKLPASSQAKPLSSRETYLFYLNVDKSGRVLGSDGKDYESPAEIVAFLRLAARNHPKLKEEEAKDQVTVIIRADKETKFRDIHKTMTAAKTVGYKKLQLRAEIGS
jgi:biopolymer transport protein ExbD